MTSTLKRLDDATIELQLTVPWSTIQAAYDATVEEFVKEAELPGFRKGMAPRQMVEEKLDTSKVYEALLRKLLPSLYNDAVKEHNLKPIITPKIELVEAKEKTDWIIKIHSCEAPVVELGNYKQSVGDMNTSKRKKIWVPGKDEKPPEEGKAPEQASIDELLLALHGAVTVKLPHLLIDQEANRLLSELVDQTKKLGLTVEQYLASTNRTADTVRHEYEEQAKRGLTLEFALEKIADSEGILVSDDDIDAILKTSKTDEEREALSKERPYLASVLRRQKTLDFLRTL